VTGTVPWVKTKLVAPLEARQSQIGSGKGKEGQIERRKFGLVTSLDTCSYSTVPGRSKFGFRISNVALNEYRSFALSSP
jgi:hypothetical protein